MSDEKHFKQLKMNIESNLNYIITGNSNIFSMVSEIIDNSLGSLGVNIADESVKINNKEIEIYFKNYKDNEGKDKLSLTITDNCGGIDNSEENAEIVMTYGKRNEEYSEPFFNVFGQGLKYSAIWSARELRLLSRKGSEKSLEIKINWLKDNKNGSYFYDFNNENEVSISYLGREQKTVDSGTQVVFDDLYREGQKYEMTQISRLYRFLGWRYAKYIERGLLLSIHFQELSGKMKYVFEGMKKNTSKIEPETPKYESFSKYFTYLANKSKKINLNRSNFNQFLWNELSPKITDQFLLNWLNDCIYKDKKMIFERSLETEHDGKNLNFPYILGIAEYSSYPNAYSYEDIYGLSVVQAHRFLEHGPRNKDNSITASKPRDFLDQKSSGGKTAVFKRFIGEISIDDYVSKFYNENVLTNNKEFFKIDKDVFYRILMEIKNSLTVKLADFVNHLKDIQKDDLYLKYLEREKKIEKEGEKENWTIPIVNPISGSANYTYNPTKIIEPINKNLKPSNLKILNRAKEERINIILCQGTLDYPLFDEAYLEFDSEDLKSVKIFINNDVFNNYSLVNNLEFKELISNLAFNVFLKNSGLQESDSRWILLSKLLNYKGE